MLHTLLPIFAFVCFVLAAFPGVRQVSLIAVGLACWVATLIF